MSIATERRQFTVAEYNRMRESGILGEDDRVELLDGEVYTMSPIGPMHIAIVNQITRLFVQCLGDTAIVSVQNPVQLDDYSEPQPDVAVLQARPDRYRNALARPEEIWLIVEVADTQSRRHREHIETVPRRSG